MGSIHDDDDDRLTVHVRTGFTDTELVNIDAARGVAPGEEDVRAARSRWIRDQLLSVLARPFDPPSILGQNTGRGEPLRRVAFRMTIAEVEALDRRRGAFPRSRWVREMVLRSVAEQVDEGVSSAFHAQVL